LLREKSCEVKTAQDLDREIQDIFALDMVGRGDQAPSVLRVIYSDESVKNAVWLPNLEGRGVKIIWQKKNP
jgi:hypothetical protein